MELSRENVKERGGGPVSVSNADTGYLRQGDRLQGRGEAPGVVVAKNGGSEASECDIRRDFGGGKGMEMGIRKAW